MVYTDSTEVPWWCAGDRDGGYEFFVYFGTGWRVTMAKQLLKTVPHPITELVVATVADMSRHEVLMWEDKVHAADLSLPVIVVEYGTSKAYICEKCVLDSFIALVKKRVFSVGQVLRACDLIEAHQKKRVTRALFGSGTPVHAHQKDCT